jgi:hypothetical protein
VIPGSAADVWKMIDTKLADIRAVIAGGQEVYLRDAKDPQDYLNFKQAIHDTKDLILALPTLMDGKDPDRDIVVVDANAAARRVDKLIQAIDDPKDHNPRFALTKLEEALATLRAHYPKGT